MARCGVQSVKRGEIWTVSGTGYSGKPRPAVVIQDDAFDATGSITICVFTSDETDAPLFRLLIEPTEANGLRTGSRLMIDKVTTIAKNKLGEKIGRLEDADMLRLNQALMVFLGLAVSPKSIDD